MENPEPATDSINRFCAQHSIESVEKHFVANGECSFWTFCIKWLECSSVPLKTSGHFDKNKPRVDYQTYFENPEDFTLFDELRQLRNILAKEGGVPAYSIFTNVQLAEMIDQKVTTKVELQKLEGIGEMKMEKYGDKVIELITEVNQRLSK